MCKLILIHIFHLAVALPEFTGCLTGTVTFSSASCAAESVVVTLTHDDNSAVKVNVELIGCCDQDDCRPDDGITSEYTYINGCLALW